MKELIENVGKNLREFRKETGLSQEQLSNRIGVDRTYVGKIERGKKSPSIKTLKKLADELDIHIKEFFEFD